MFSKFILNFATFVKNYFNGQLLYCRYGKLALFPFSPRSAQNFFDSLFNQSLCRMFQIFIAVLWGKNVKSYIYEYNLTNVYNFILHYKLIVLFIAKVACGFEFHALNFLQKTCCFFDN